MFNIFSKLQAELETTETERLQLVRKPNEQWTLTQANTYGYNQLNTIGKIDMACLSQYESGMIDTDGQRKLYLNIVNFVREVAKMRTDIDVKNYVFIPDGQKDIWPTFLMSRQFKLWARKNYYGAILNELNDDYSKYGTCVVKRLKGKLERVPIRNLRNTQNAKSLNHAAMTGGFVIEVHEMSKLEMEEYKGWDTDDFDYDQKYTVYERYGIVPLAYIKEQNDQPFKDKEWDIWVPAMAMLVPSVKQKKGNETGEVLFIEQIDRIPYEEAHWNKQDGRWLGIGEVEQQFENQIAQNLNANMLRKQMYWASKKVFQSASEEVQKNLVRDVKDGQVLYVGMNGQITQVATEARSLAEFQQSEKLWDSNSKDKSFAFEVATGEAMPSGTPFRLGVVLSTAVETHFALKKENFGIFLQKSFFELLLPIFKKETKDHVISMTHTEEGADQLREAMIAIKTSDYIKSELLAGRIPNPETVKMEVQDKLIKSPYMFVEVIKGFYDDAQNYMDLVITDESQDVATDVASLTSLYQTMAQSGDPRAERVLETILSKSGKSLQAIAGLKQSVPSPLAQNQGSQAMPEAPQGMPQVPANIQ